MAGDFHLTHIYWLRGPGLFWRAELGTDVLTITEGDMRNPKAAEVRTHRGATNDLYKIVDEEMLDRLNRGYDELLPDEFEAQLAKVGKAASSSKSPRTSSKRGGAAAGPQSRPLVIPPKSIVAAKSDKAAPPAPIHVQPRHSGPYARTFTGPVIHRLRFEPAAKTAASRTARATSGGRPIMAEGQPVPLCAYCDQRLALYLQFDVEQRFQLAFPAGSHILLFHCPDCSRAIPPSPSGLTMPTEWLDPNLRSSYRIIVNPPNLREVVHEKDPRIKEQQVTFATAAEKVTENLDGPVGREEVKVGGLPHWVQPPLYGQCACGAPLGFMMQVPALKTVGWMRKKPNDVPFAGGLSAFLFACTVMSNPFAAVLVVQR
jgi:hypothetical protein